MSGLIAGIALSYGEGQSPQFVDQAVFGETLSWTSSPMTPADVVQKAIGTAGLSQDTPVGILPLGSGNHADFLPRQLRSCSLLTDQIPQAADLPEALVFAANWLKDQQNRGIVIARAEPIGCGAILLVHPSRNLSGYAVVEYLGTLSSEGLTKEAAVRAAQGPPPEYLELPPELQALESAYWRLLEEWFQIPSHPAGCALGSIAPSIADRSGLTGLIHAARVLHNRELPGFPDSLRGLLDTQSPSGAFYAPVMSRPWLENGHPQRAGLALSRGKSGWHLYRLHNPARSKPLPAVQAGSTPHRKVIIPFSGDTETSLIDKLTFLENSIASGDDLDRIGAQAYQQIRQGVGRMSGCLLGSDRDTFLREIQLLKNSLPPSIRTGKAQSTPIGSCFVPKPLGKQGVALIYPGAFNSYPGMGRELFHHFPRLHQIVRKTTRNISRSLAETFLYPRSLQPLSSQEKKELEIDFFNHPIELIESGTSLAVLHTLILKEIFQLQPAAAFGYSLGEISMLWANQIWQGGEQSSLAWRNSSLFKSKLFGKMTAVREYWDGEDLADQFWGTFILKATPEDTASALEGEKDAFLTIINTPDEVVIAGKRASCLRVIEILGCRSLPVPIEAAIHNPAMSSTYQDFVDLHTQPVHPQPGMEFYSAAAYQPLSIKPEALARSIAAMTCQQVNFPRLVRQIYQDGVRIFIEVGPQKTCTRWVQAVLEKVPHAAVPMNKKYQADLDGILKVLSLLISHQVEINLESIFPGHQTTPVRALYQEGDWEAAVPSPQERGRTAQKIPADSLAPVMVNTVDLPLQTLSQHASRSARAHQSYLSLQQVLTRNLKKTLTLAAEDLTSGSKTLPGPAPVFSHEQIQAFTRGNHERCFGRTYAVFEGRRIPCLPNGALQFMDRVMSLEAQAGKVESGASITAEFDIPDRAWYFPEDRGHLPHLALMEISLQPCGFLAAYMGSILDHPEVDFYFRNLDGEGRLLRELPPPGSTIENQAVLVSSSTLQDTIIQQYQFELSSYGAPFYRGTASFGFFPAKMLRQQKGLDGGKPFLPWRKSHPESGNWHTSREQAGQDPAIPGLPSFERIWISPTGGRYGAGYIFLDQSIPPESWFYPAHFYQDPVMPGSLGVELMSRMLQEAAPQLTLEKDSTWRMKQNSGTSWKYRGQITRSVGSIQLELHVKDIQKNQHQQAVTGDGSLIRDQLRIYQVNDLALETGD